MFGARPLGRVIQKEVRDVLTDQILFRALEHGGTVTIDIADNHVVFAYDSPGSERCPRSLDACPPLEQDEVRSRTRASAPCQRPRRRV